MRVWHARPIGDSDAEAILTLIGEVSHSRSAGEQFLGLVQQADPQHDSTIIVRGCDVVACAVYDRAHGAVVYARPDPQAPDIEAWLARWEAWRAQSASSQ